MSDLYSPNNFKRGFRDGNGAVRRDGGSFTITDLRTSTTWLWFQILLLHLNSCLELGDRE